MPVLQQRLSLFSAVGIGLVWALVCIGLVLRTRLSGCAGQRQ